MYGKALKGQRILVHMRPLVLSTRPKLVQQPVRFRNRPAFRNLPVLNPENVHDLKFDRSTDRLDASQVGFPQVYSP